MTDLHTIAEMFAVLDGRERYHEQLELFAWWRIQRRREQSRVLRCPPSPEQIRSARRLVERNRYARWKAEGPPAKKHLARVTDYKNRWKTDPAWRRRAA